MTKPLREMTVEELVAEKVRWEDACSKAPTVSHCIFARAKWVEADAELARREKEERG